MCHLYPLLSAFLALGRATFPINLCHCDWCCVCACSVVVSPPHPDPLVLVPRLLQKMRFLSFGMIELVFSGQCPAESARLCPAWGSFALYFYKHWKGCAEMEGSEGDWWAIRMAAGRRGSYKVRGRVWKCKEKEGEAVILCVITKLIFF